MVPFNIFTIQNELNNTYDEKETFRELLKKHLTYHYACVQLFTLFSKSYELKMI